MNQKIFGALALSMAFAACTNEEELVISNGNDGQVGDRVKLGKVELSTVPATRAVVGEGTWNTLEFENEDAIGAALVDELNGQPVNGTIKNWTGMSWTYAQYATGYQNKVGNDKKTLEQAGGNPHGFFDVVSNTIYTNYGYTYNGESWKTEANLVEGHYMFYFPFNINNSARQPIDVKVPTTQNCATASSAIAEFYDGTSPVAVDVKFLKRPAAGEKMSVKADLQHLFAYPQITIVNDFNGLIYDMMKEDGGQAIDEAASLTSTKNTKVKTTMTIDKIELYYAGNEIKLWHTAKFDAKQLDNRINDNAVAERNWAANVNQFEKVSYTSDVVNDEAASFAPTLKPYVTTIADDAEYTTAQTITCNINKTLANGEEYVFNAIMPAENYGTNNLKARVYVTIEGKQYVMLTSNAPTANYQDGDSKKPIVSYSTTGITGTYTFATDKPIELVRNQRYPIIEYKVADDGQTSVKNTAGNMLTISMSGLSAFEAGKFEKDNVEKKYRGFSNEDEFIAHMQDATRATTLTEVQSESNEGLGEHQIAFKPGHTVVLTAELVNKIYKNVNYNNAPAVHLELNCTNLPIANDVQVTYVAANKYQLKATTGDKNTITVQYGDGVINTNGGSLKSGINEISGTVSELKGSGTGVVYLNSGNITVKNGADSFRITVKAGVTLTVNGACNALLDVKNGAKIIIGENGSLTNANSTFETATDLTDDSKCISITNKYLKQIAANVKNNLVTADFTAWPTSVPASSKVNNVVIETPAETISLMVDQANFNVFEVANTTVTLTGGVKSLISTANVDLTGTNIKQLTGTATWSAATGTIVVTSYAAKYDDKSNLINPVQIAATITADASVKYNKIAR